MSMNRRLDALEDSVSGELGKTPKEPTMSPSECQQRIGELLDKACADHNTSPNHVHPHTTSQGERGQRIDELLRSCGWHVWHEPGGMMRWQQPSQMQ